MDGTGTPMTPDTPDTNKESIAALIGRLDDPAIDNRHNAVLALAGIGPDAVQPLIRSLAEATEDERRWYRSVALAKVGTPIIAPAHCGHERESRSASSGAILPSALGELGEAAGRTPHRCDGMR